MTLSARTDLGLKPVTRVRVRDGAALRDVSKAFVRDGSALRQVYSASSGILSVSVIPGSAYGAGTGTSARTIRTQTVNATATGGRAPYTFAWSPVSATLLSITNPSAAETSFERMLQPNTSAAGDFQCTVTDAAGASIVSAPVHAEVYLSQSGNPSN